MKPRDLRHRVFCDRHPAGRTNVSSLIVRIPSEQRLHFPLLSRDQRGALCNRFDNGINNGTDSGDGGKEEKKNQNPLHADFFYRAQPM